MKVYCILSVYNIQVTIFILWLPSCLPQYVEITATIDQSNDGMLICNVKKDNESIVGGLKYQWYDGRRKLKGATGSAFIQNSDSFESVQKYKCVIEYRASNWDPDVTVEARSNTLKNRKWN